LFARNNGGSNGGAVYFDVNVLNPAGITVRSLEINTNDTVAFTLDVYTGPATWVGNTTNMGLWTIVASGAGVGQGANNPTPVDISDFNLSPGPIAIAIVVGPTIGHDYTNGNGANQFYSNVDLEISLGGASNVPFAGTAFSPRVWNGTICYDPPAECWLMAGLRPTAMPIGNDTLLVEPLAMFEMSTVQLPVINVPNQPGLIGVSVYVQGFLYNPLYYPTDPIKLSAGIEFKIGVETKTYGVGSGLGMWPIGSIVAQPGGKIEIDFSLP
jgi:hypothetical protein